MSIHPSLNIPEKDKKPRSVLKRIERIKLMIEKSQWTENDSVYGLPKIKSLRIKIKKEKAEKVETAVGEATAVAPAATDAKAQPAAKGATAKGATAKGATAKGQEKK